MVRFFMQLKWPWRFFVKMLYVEVIYLFFIPMISTLKCFYSIFTIKRNIHDHLKYRTRAIKTRSWFETTLNYKPRIFKVRKVLQTALQYKLRYVKL